MERRSNPSGIFFRSHLEQHLFLQNTLRLDAPVDLSCIEEAWRQTLISCPFFEQGVEVENDRLIYVSRRSKCRVTDFSEKHPFADGDLAWVQAEEDRIRVGVSHALTDEHHKSAHSFMVPVSVVIFCRSLIDSYPFLFMPLIVLS